MAFRSDTGLSRPTLTALLASVMSDEPIGSLVKVIWSNEAATMAGFRLLPLTAARAGTAPHPPGIEPDLKASTASELGVIGVIGTSPPPVDVEVRPLVLSQ